MFSNGFKRFEGLLKSLMGAGGQLIREEVPGCRTNPRAKAIARCLLWGNSGVARSFGFVTVTASWTIVISNGFERFQTVSSDFKRLCSECQNQILDLKMLKIRPLASRHSNGIH